MVEKRRKPIIDLDLNTIASTGKQLTIRQVQLLPIERQRAIWESFFKESGLDRYLTNIASEFANSIQVASNFQKSLYPVIEAQKRFADNIRRALESAKMMQGIARSIVEAGEKLHKDIQRFNSSSFLTDVIASPRIKLDVRPQKQYKAQREFDSFLIDSLVGDIPLLEEKTTPPYFDKVKITLEIARRSVSFPPNSMMHDLLLLLFSFREPVKEHHQWSALHIQIFGDSPPKQYRARKKAMDRVRLAIDRTNKRIALTTLIADLILYENSIFRLNPKYFE